MEINPCPKTASERDYKETFPKRPAGLCSPAPAPGESSLHPCIAAAPPGEPLPNQIGAVRPDTKNALREDKAESCNPHPPAQTQIQPRNSWRSFGTAVPRVFLIKSARHVQLLLLVVSWHFFFQGRFSAGFYQDRCQDFSAWEHGWDMESHMQRDLSNYHTLGLVWNAPALHGPPFPTSKNRAGALHPSWCLSSGSCHVRRWSKFLHRLGSACRGSCRSRSCWWGRVTFFPWEVLMRCHNLHF